MPLPPESERWDVELRELREELHQLREEQQQLARAIDQLVRTFQALAHQLGITAEPYARKSDRRDRDVPGFG
jgi:predicted  nucleic acid-binding Zn-ribbon protein